MAVAVQAQRRTSQPTSRRPLSVRTFFVATFALSWGMGIMMTVFVDRVEAVFGPIGYTNPVFVLVVWAPGIVGLVTVALHGGRAGVLRFLGRLALWRMPALWWAVLLGGVPLVFHAGAALGGMASTPFASDPWYAVLPALLPALLIGPVEELGWRGVALPLLQRRFTPLGAALVVGVVAAVWHTPSFLLSGTKQSGWSYWPFFLGIVAISVILTAMFNASRGSLLVPVLFHAQVNSPMWPDAQPWDMYLFALVAVLVVVHDRRAMLSRGGGMTEVLPTDGGTRPRDQESGDGEKRRRTLAAYAGVLAFTAYAGAVGLATGELGLAPHLVQRLPFASPVLASTALVMVVAVPATVLALRAYGGDARTERTALLTGLLVIGWIVVQMAFLRQLSPLHPVYLAVGAGLVFWGRRGNRTSRKDVQP